MIVLYRPDHDPSRLYYGTDTPSQALLIGAVLAFVFAGAVAISRSSACSLRRAGPWSLRRGLPHPRRVHRERPVHLALPRWVHRRCSCRGGLGRGGDDPRTRAKSLGNSPARSNRAHLLRPLPLALAALHVSLPPTYGAHGRRVSRWSASRPRSRSRLPPTSCWSSRSERGKWAWVGSRRSGSLQVRLSSLVACSSRHRPGSRSLHPQTRPLARSRLGRRCHERTTHIHHDARTVVAENHPDRSRRRLSRVHARPLRRTREPRAAGDGPRGHHHRLRDRRRRCSRRWCAVPAPTAVHDLGTDLCKRHGEDPARCVRAAHRHVGDLRPDPRWSDHHIWVRSRPPPREATTRSSAVALTNTGAPLILLTSPCFSPPRRDLGAWGEQNARNPGASTGSTRSYADTRLNIQLTSLSAIFTRCSALGASTRLKSTECTCVATACTSRKEGSAFTFEWLIPYVRGVAQRPARHG